MICIMFFYPLYVFIITFANNNNYSIWVLIKLL